MIDLEQDAYFDRGDFFAPVHAGGIGWGGIHDPVEHPELLRDLTWRGHRFGQCHEYAWALWMNFFDDTVPWIPGGLKDGQLGCFVNRNIRGSDQRSAHSGGIACDENWSENPMGADHETFGNDGVIPPRVGRIARRYGILWGGRFRGRPDWMHFEIHVPPHKVRKVRRYRASWFRYHVKHVALIGHRRRWEKRAG